MDKYKELLSRLNGVRIRTERQCVARCPAHDDQHQSLSIGLGKEDKILMTCHAGCTTENVLSAVGMTYKDLGSPSLKPNANERCYDYVDEEGNFLFQVVRKAGKEFRCRKRDAQGNWTYSLGDTRRILYRLPDVLKAPFSEVIWAPEGEKDVETLRRLGLVATTNPHGAGKWKPAYSEFLRGRIVAILPDNDDRGREHARQVADSLRGVAKEVRIVELPGLSPKGDVTDFVNAGGTVEVLREQFALAATPTDTRPPADTPPAHLEVRDDGFYYLSPRDEYIRMTNFTAQVEEEIATITSGGFLLIARVRVSAGGTDQVVELPIKELNGIDWVPERVGLRTIIFARKLARDHLLAAITSCYPPPRRVTRFGQMGWHRSNDGWMYVHGAGAITATGHVAGVTVDPNLASRALPAPAQGDARQAALRAALRLLQVAPPKVSHILLLAPFRAVLGNNDFSVTLVGPTGTLKTSIAQVLNAFFSDSNPSAMMESWQSTENALEAWRFQMKDTIGVIDDYAPYGDRREMGLLHQKVERVLRGEGNGAGRSRSARDGSYTRPPTASALLFLTAEAVPGGQSLRARQLVLEIDEGEVNLPVLSKLQKESLDGNLASVTAAFCSWLAEQYDRVSGEWPSQLQAWRAAFSCP